MTAVRVLVVEDNLADARLLEELLREVPERPFTLTVVGTLADAIRVASDHDVALLDLSLPDAHGVETVERMVASARAMPLVVLTGLDDEKVASDAMKAGAQDYVVKAEITASLVARSIRYAIERKRAEATEAERRRLEQAAARARFIAAVTAESTRSLEMDVALNAVARSVLPVLGDACVIDLPRDDGTFVRVALAGVTPALEEAFAVISEYPPGRLHPRAPVIDAVRRRATIRVDDFDAEEVSPDARYREVATRAGVRSVMVTPLVAAGRVIAAISYVMGPSGRSFRDEDQLLAEEIAARIALALENARLYGEAQRAIRARDELLAVVSHDLRNPLGVVSLAVRMMETAAEARRPQFIQRAQRGLARMQRIIEDLLDVARIDSGTLKVNPEATELAVVLDDAYELHRPLATEREIFLVRDYLPPLGIVLADRDRVAQVLSNLLGNALKFTPKGGTVRLGAKLSPEGASVYVQDTGPGIAADGLRHVFDRFWQASHRPDGVGLGLAIAKGIVEAHGGKIDVESAPGSGASFRFVLPRPDPDVRAPPS